MKTILFSALFLAGAAYAGAQTVESLPYGNMDTWVTRQIKESRVLGGDWKNCYAVGPEMTVKSDKPYVNAGGSPWASSNVMAKMMGITKVSTSVMPCEHPGHGKCARLTTDMEHCKAIGLINVDVVVAGTLFLGRMLEPVKSTKDPYAKMEMGIPYTKRPKALQYDYKLSIPVGSGRVYSSGFGKQRKMRGDDRAEVIILLQHRWEDADGNIHARRVGTGRELLAGVTPWKNGHRLEIHYGDITSQPFYKPFMGLIPVEKSYYAANSAGEMVPVVEEGWDSTDAMPTHMVLMFSSGSGEPYVGTLGSEFLVDNVAMVF